MTTAPLSAFCPSPTNPRTRFGGPEDDALVENIRLHGIIQPIVVRLWPATSPWPAISAARRSAVSPAGAGECGVENPGQAEPRVFQVGDVVRIVRCALGSVLTEFIGQVGQVKGFAISHLRPGVQVMVTEIDGLELFLFPEEVQWIGGPGPSQPGEEAIETNEKPTSAQPPHFETGARVRVKDDAKGPNGIRCKCSGRVGTVINKGTYGCRVKFDPGQGGEPTANVIWSNLEKLEIETNEKPSYAQRTAEAARVAYRHPDNADMCWSGRGRKPKWVENWLAEGGSLDELAVPPSKPAKAGKQQQVQASSADSAYRCDKTADMFHGGAA